MATFLFRLQAALDLRVRQEDEAKGALAKAEASRAAAARSRDEAQRAVEDAHARSREAEGRGGDLTERVWYRNWIAARRLDLERRRKTLAACEDGVRQATAAVQAAHRRRRILERLKDRAARRFDHAERREEQKGFDDLGTQRFNTATRGDHP